MKLIVTKLVDLSMYHKITNMTCQLDLPMTAVTFLFSSLSSLATPSGGVDFGT